MSWDLFVALYAWGVVIWIGGDMLNWATVALSLPHRRKCERCGMQPLPWAKGTWRMIGRTVIIGVFWPLDIAWTVIAFPRTILRGIRAWRAARVIRQTEIEKALAVTVDEG